MNEQTSAAREKAVSDLYDMLAPFSAPSSRPNRKAVEKAVDSLVNLAVIRLLKERDAAGSRSGSPDTGQG